MNTLYKISNTNPKILFPYRKGKFKFRSYTIINKILYLWYINNYPNYETIEIYKPLKLRSNNYLAYNRTTTLKRKSFNNQYSLLVLGSRDAVDLSSRSKIDFKASLSKYKKFNFIL